MSVSPGERESFTRLPRHVAFIMDGNGRWARKRGLPRRAGHREGAESVRAVVEECARLGVEALTLYVFSTENWSRPKSEVAYLMRLMKRFLVEQRGELLKRDIALRAIGRLDDFPTDIRAELDKTIQASKSNTGMVLRMAVNYGGRQEIADAAARIAEAAAAGTLKPSEVTVEMFPRYAYEADMPDPDLLIRTGGEMRLSNFLLWHLSYAELYFTKVCWPDFRAAQLRQAFRAYAARERRYGGLPKAKRSKGA